MQPGKPLQGLARATCRAEISTYCSGRQRVIARSTSVPRQASAFEHAAFAARERGHRGRDVGAVHANLRPG